MSDDEPTIRVTCRDCGFEKTVRTDDGKPAEVLVEHGERTGHTLSISRLETDEPDGEE